MTDKRGINMNMKNGLKIAGCFAIAGLFLAAALLALPAQAGTPHNVATYLFNPGESWADGVGAALSGNPSDFGDMHHYTLDKDPTLTATLYSPTLTLKGGDWEPTQDYLDVGSPWTWQPLPTTWCGVAQIYTGLNGYVGAQNYTAAGVYPLSLEATDFHPGMQLSAIPTPLETSNDGTTLVMGWTGQATLNDDDNWVGTWIETNLLVSYLVQADFGTGWVTVDTVANTPGGALSSTYTWGSNGEAMAIYPFRIVPQYKGPNYDNAGTLFTTTATSAWALFEYAIVTPPVNIELRTTSGFQMIAPPTNDLAGYTAVNMSVDIETNTDMDVVMISMYDGTKWVDYLRRGSDGTLLPQFAYTDFNLVAGHGYFVQLRNPGAAVDFTWETAWTGAAAPLAINLHTGWNGVGVVYTDSWTTIGSAVDGVNIDRAVVWNNGWVNNDALSLFDQPVTTQTFDPTANAHGFYVRTPAPYMWTQA